VDDTPYRELAARLDELPNGFPPTEDGVELSLLARLFTPEEAALAARLRLTLETPAEIVSRIGGRVGGDPQALRTQLKEMAKRGLITAGRAPAGGLGFGVMPFVVGIYEMQAGRIDGELARLFEAYYQRSYRRSLTQQPPVHRVIPVAQTVRNDMAVHPYESATEIITGARAWAVTDCICRKQQALLGQACEHPLDVCMVFSETAGAFDRMAGMRALTQDEALATLRRAAEAGLVHSVSNNQKGLWYLCNCCTCACGILRGLAELGMANVIATSAFLCQVDEDKCIACGECTERCSFGALTVDLTAQVDVMRCAGCGVCVLACPQEALSLLRRPEAEVLAPPATEEDWRAARAGARGIDLAQVR
jgi:Na+-translocating ferredoxin:NAD+ oxidoreductase subunit B